MYIASLVLGIVSLLLSFIPVLGFIIAIVALIISIIALVKKDTESKGKGMEIAGIILSIIATVISLLITLSTIRLIDSNNIVNNAISVRDEQNRIEAEEFLNIKYNEINSKNANNKYTGYINRYTEEYTDSVNSIPIDEFYEEYLEDKLYDYDVRVDINGVPSIEID